ncbi:MAG: CofH family radical SAM protein [Phycisphaerae bacterium]
MTLLAPPIDIIDPALASIREKVVANQRLTREDGRALFKSRDIFTIGELANLVRERRHGRQAYYNINQHINYSNFCVLRCKFCAFYRPFDKAGDHAEDSYELSVEEVVERCQGAAKAGATEVHIVGGLHPKLPFSYYTDMCRGIKAACPTLAIKAFTAIEIVHFTRITKPRLNIEEVLIALREAGLDTLPGGGAEIFDDRVHDEAYKAKVGEKHWFDVHDTAHRLGIPTNATMLYGHIENADERIEHLIKLRDQQDRSLARCANDECRMTNDEWKSHDATRHPTPDTPAHGAKIKPAAFQCLIPLSFIPDGSELSHLPGPTGLDDLKTLAISRLMLDNFDHIKAFWIMQSPKLSQVSLNWGVDDFDGTVVWYDITKREGRGTNHQELTVDQIRRLIREAGCEPVERDSFYREVVR